MTPPLFRALTIRSKSGARLQVISCECGISAAFDPRVPPATHPLAVPFTAIWDTGASASAISRQVVAKCGLQPTGMKRVQLANGTHDAETVLINLRLPNGVGFANMEVTIGDLGPGPQVLIGMDIIGIGDFAITNVGGATICSFRVPSVKTIDYVQEIRDLQARSSGGRGPAGGTPPKAFGTRPKKHK